MSRLLALASIFFCFEIGLFLIVIPWTELWEGNYLLSFVPRLQPLVLHDGFRSAVTALGGIDVLIGLFEIKNFVKMLRVSDRIPE
jgi:hypothetical protein